MVLAKLSTEFDVTVGARIDEINVILRGLESVEVACDSDLDLKTKFHYLREVFERFVLLKTCIFGLGAAAA
jgi:hypothetical protein